jgi:hypothetical protein
MPVSKLFMTVFLMRTAPPIPYKEFSRMGNSQILIFR